MTIMLVMMPLTAVNLLFAMIRISAGYSDHLGIGLSCCASCCQLPFLVGLDGRNPSQPQCHIPDVLALETCCNAQRSFQRVFVSAQNPSDSGKD